MGEIYIGEVINIKATVKYVLKGLKSHDRVCLTIGGKDVWLELPKGALDGRKKDVCKVDSVQ